MAALATESCSVTGAVQHFAGGQVGVFQGRRLGASLELLAGLAAAPTG